MKRNNLTTGLSCLSTGKGAAGTSCILSYSHPSPKPPPSLSVLDFPRSLHPVLTGAPAFRKWEASSPRQPTWRCVQDSSAGQSCCTRRLGLVWWSGVRLGGPAPSFSRTSRMSHPSPVRRTHRPAVPAAATQGGEAPPGSGCRSRPATIHPGRAPHRAGPSRLGRECEEGRWS